MAEVTPPSLESVWKTFCRGVATGNVKRPAAFMNGLLTARKYMLQAASDEVNQRPSSVRPEARGDTRPDDEHSL